MILFGIFTGVVALAVMLGYIGSSAKCTWMSYESTLSLKGIAIITVMWAHIGAGLGISGLQFIAGIGVSIFLICSGYGLECSVKKHGMQGFVKKRLLRVMVPFWIIELIIFITGEKLSITDELLNLLCVKQRSGFHWFIQYILICYMAFAGTKILSEKFKFIKRHEECWILSVFMIWFFIEIMVNQDSTFLRSRQMLAFPIGVMLANHKETIEEYIEKHKTATTLLTVAGGGIALSIVYLTHKSVIAIIPASILSLFSVVVLGVVLITFCKLFPEIHSNRVSIFLGGISYEVYLVHVEFLRMLDGSVQSLCWFVLSVGLISNVFHYVVKKFMKA